MNRYRSYILSILFLTSFGCSQSLDNEAYVSWIRSYDNGLHVKKEVNEYLFDVQYQPPYYLSLLREQNGRPTKPQAQQDPPGDDLQYYVITIGLKDNKTDFIDYQISSRPEKQQKLYYYAYNFQQDIMLEENGEKLPCLLFHFERQMDLRPTRTFVLGFAKTTLATKSSRLIINSPWISSVPVKIKISKDNIPTPKSYEAGL